MRASLQGDVLGTGESGAGRSYEVLAISAGEGNGLEYGADVLRAALALFEGVTVCVDHAQMGELGSLTGGRSLRQVLGVLEGCRWSEQARGVQGALRVYPGPDAGWFCAMLDRYLADRAAGRPTPHVGLSAVVDVQVEQRRVTRIERVLSVDAVFDPARGGEFLRALNQRSTDFADYADGAGRDGYPVTGDERGVTDGGSGAARGTCGLTDQKDRGGIGEMGQVKNEGQMGSEEDKRVAVSGGDAEAEAATSGQSGAGVLVPMANPAVADRRLVGLAENVLELRLGASGLPEPMRALLRQQFGGRVFDAGELERQMEALQAAWATSVGEAGLGPRGAGAEAGAGSSGWRVGMDEGQRLQAVMDRLCGLQLSGEALQGVRPVSGIRELYLMLTGDYDFRGVFDHERVALANVSSSTMTSLVKNAFNKVILDYFQQVERWWEPIVSAERLDSMQDLTLITLGGFADLPTVDEGNAYTELNWSDAEETVSFVKKGGYVGVTLEMMDKDKTQAFRSIPRRLAVAGYRTLSALIANVFTDGSGYGPYWPSSQESVRLFSADHANVATSALSSEAWDACIQAMYKQVEATSAERMGIRPGYLVVPIELEKTALTIMQSEGEPGTGDNDANVRRGSSRVVVCPEFTDANDWAAVANPRVWPGIVVGYRFGSVPEVFVAGDELLGSMFTNDEMRIKARFVVAVGVGDYRSLYKAVVA